MFPEMAASSPGKVAASMSADASADSGGNGSEASPSMDKKGRIGGLGALIFVLAMLIYLGYIRYFAANFNYFTSICILLSIGLVGLIRYLSARQARNPHG